MCVRNKMLFCVVLDITQAVNLQKNQTSTMAKNGRSKSESIKIVRFKVIRTAFFWDVATQL